MVYTVYGNGLFTHNVPAPLRHQLEGLVDISDDHWFGNLGRTSALRLR